MEDVQWTNQFDLELDYDLKSSIDQDEHLGHSKSIIQSVKWKKNSETFALHIHKHHVKFIAQRCDVGLGSHQASTKFNNKNENEDETKCLNMT